MSNASTATSPAVAVAVVPSVTMTAPAGGATTFVGGPPITMTAATTPPALSTTVFVEYLVDGAATSIGFSTVAPYSFTWTPTVANFGVHNLTAKAYYSNGATSTSTAVPFTVNVVKNDFNFDGKTDILWQKDTGESMLWSMNGTSYVSTINMPTEVDTSWKMVAAGDFNNDGKPDTVWRNISTGANRIWLMNGTAQLSSVALPADANLNAKIGGTGDFNADGNIDIVWRDATAGTTYVWLMTGTTFSSSVAITPANTNAAVQIVSTGDFNGDGKVDIVFRNTAPAGTLNSGNTFIWLMNGTTRLTNTTVLPANTNLAANIFGTADYNNDGQTDILWRNTTNGNDFIWLMSGVNRTSNISTQPLPLPANAGWNIVSR